MGFSPHRPRWPTLLPLCLLLAAAPSAGADLRLDGGELGWDTGRWRSQVDGVMGGRSTGTLRFEDGDDTLSFSGTISLDGGGFSSVRKDFAAAADLTPYAGVVVRMATTRAHEGGTARAPLGLHLQFHDTVARSLGFAAAFAVPLASASGEDTSVFLPLSSFDRGSRMGFTCSDCRIDFSTVDEMDIYVLFQEGPFDIEVKSITAVESPVSFDSPVIDVGSATEIQALIDSTTQSGGGLYNQGYIGLCNAIYRSTLNTLLAARPSGGGDGAEGAVTPEIRGMICQGLQRAETQSGSNTDVAWTLRHTLDGILETLGFADQGTGWRPAAGAAGDYECRGVTSGAYIAAVTSAPTRSPITRAPTASPSSLRIDTTAPSMAPTTAPTSTPTAALSAKPTPSPTTKPTVPLVSVLGAAADSTMGTNITIASVTTATPFNDTLNGTMDTHTHTVNETTTTATTPTVPVANVPIATIKITMETNATTTHQSASPIPVPPDAPMLAARPTSTPDTATNANAESGDAPRTIPEEALIAELESEDQRNTMGGDGSAPASILSSSTSTMPRAEIVAALAMAAFLYVGV